MSAAPNSVTPAENRVWLRAHRLAVAYEYGALNCALLADEVVRRVRMGMREDNAIHDVVRPKSAKAFGTHPETAA